MVDFNIFTSLVSPIIVIACLIVGYILKNLCPNNEINKYIPLIVALLGAGFNVWATGSFGFNIILSGAASGLVSTGTYEMFKNFLEK